MSKPSNVRSRLDRARPLDRQKAHEIILEEARSMARQAAASGDDGTNDLLVGSIIRGNEKQVWFVAEHVVDVPLVKAD